MKLDSQELLAKLRSEPAPVSWAKLKKSFAGKKSGVTEEELHEVLTAGNGIYAWPKKSYWHIDPERRLEGEILAECGKKAVALTSVKGANKKMAVERLAAAGKLVKYPAVEGKKSVFLTAGSDATDAYWAYVRETVAAKLKKAGIEEAGLEEKIWEILPKLEPEVNVPVSTARVRRALGLSESDKARFDEAALKLREQRRIYLSQHDHPMGVSAEERELLIDGKDGRHYVAISRREQ